METSLVFSLALYMTIYVYLTSSAPVVPNQDFTTAPQHKNRILHVTDFHTDTLYTVGARVEDACHAGLASTTEGPKESFTVGKYGAPLTGCDGPIALLNVTFDFIGAMQDVSLVVWTGDNARHDNDKRRNPRTWHEQKHLETITTAYFLDAFGYRGTETHTRVPVVPSLGNNDVSPHNQLSYDPLEPNETLEFFSGLWIKFIPEDQLDTFRVGGYYVVRDALPGLDVVALNTLYFFKKNHDEGVGDCEDDDSSGGAMQIDWLHGVFQNAKRRNKRVLLTGHIPPLVHYYYAGCIRQYTHLLDRFADILEPGLFGHTHTDVFEFTSPDLVEDAVLQQAKRDDIPTNENDDRIFDAHTETPIIAMQWPNSFIKRHLDLYDVIASTRSLPKRNSPNLVLTAPSVVSEYMPSVRVFTYSLNSNRFKALEDYTQYFIDLKKWYATHPEDTRPIERTRKTYIEQIRHWLFLLLSLFRDQKQEVEIRPKFQVEYNPRDAYNIGSNRSLTDGFMNVAREISQRHSSGSCMDTLKKWVLYLFVSTGVWQVSDGAMMFTDDPNVVDMTTL